MIFSKKKIMLEYTLEICPKCESQRKRKFGPGDILFSESSKCTSCGEVMIIEKIFGETANT